MINYSFKQSRKMMLKPTIELEEWISYGKPVT